jgi:transcriptional regulator with XRE-family HTH domain
MLGNEIRVRRTDLRFSLAQLSTEVVWDKSYLAKFERGERQPTKTQITDIDHALEAHGVLVRLWDLASRWETQGDTVQADVANHDLHVANDVATMAPNDRVRAQWAEDETVAVPARGPDGTELMVQVNRRLFLGGLGAAAIAGTAGAPAMASPIPSGVDPVQHFRAAKVKLMDRDNLRGPSAAISDAQQHLVAMTDLVTNMRGGDRRRLIEVQAQMADLAGWLYQDSGYLDGASYWLAKSIEISHFVDGQVTAFMFARKSQMLAETDDPHGALDSALAAVEMARPNSRIACVANTFAGHAHALLGDREHSQAHYQTAHTELERMEEAGPGSAYALFMCPAYVLSYQARSLASMRDYTASAERFTAALAQLDPAMHRDRGVYTAWLAQSLAGAGDHEQAAQRGMEALAIASGTGSARILTELRQLSDQLPRASARATAFRDALVDLEERT